nr:Ig-like domain-containing protein [Sediminivirga luteola]
MAQTGGTVTHIEIQTDDGEAEGPGGVVSVWQSISIYAEWEADAAAVAGDGFVIILPEELTGFVMEFPLLDEGRDNAEVGRCEVSAGQIVCRFTDYVERYENVHGWVRFEALVEADAEGEDTLVFLTGEDVEIEVPVPGGPVRSPDEYEFPYPWDSYKSSWPIPYGEGRIGWGISITDDALPSEPADLLVVDNLAGLELVPGSLQIEYALAETWVEEERGPWYELPESGYTLGADPDWPLNVTLHDVVGDGTTVYRILYETPLPEGVEDGDTFVNDVLIGEVAVSWEHTYYDGEGSGSGDEPQPTPSPTTEPTTDPTTEPTTEPTTDATTEPTTDPTTDPSTVPTTDPTTEPTTDPTTDPTTEPTTEPSADPTTEPTTDPSTVPTTDATTEPTTDPTTDPTTEPTTEPSADPTTEPTTDPSTVPTTDATTEPTTDPTTDPTTEPTTEPSADPTTEPTTDPSTVPTTDATTEPTTDPTTDPTTEPTTEPSTDLTTDPTTVSTTEPATDPTESPGAPAPSVSPSVPAGGDPAGQLPRTGSAVAAAMVAGAMLLGLGGVLLLSVKRRP